MPVKDRLAELRGKASEAEKAENFDSNGALGNTPASPTAMELAMARRPSSFVIHVEMQRIHEMGRYFEEVEKIREAISDLDEDVHNVEKHHTDLLSLANPNETVRKELDSFNLSIKTKSLQIRSKLKEMKNGIAKDETDEEPPSAAILRARKHQHSALSIEFVEVMTTYQNVQQDYCDKSKKRLKNELVIAGTDFTEEMVEEMMEEGKFSIFTDNMVHETEQARQTLADVEARHNDILKLEKSLIELHDMFMEMAALVESQGEMIDRIETHVTATQDYVETANIQLKKAVLLQSAARRKLIWIIVMVILLVVVFCVLSFAWPKIVWVGALGAGVIFVLGILIYCKWG